MAVFRSELPLFQPVSFELKSGEALQISGANGSGKTSLLRCICGLSSRHEGKISWNALPIESNSEEYLKTLLYLGHSLGLKPKLTIRQNLQFYQSLRFETDEKPMIKALKALNIEAYIDELVGKLSAGQKRRVALARIICEPVKLWILDEPMVALDVDGQAWLEQTCNKHLKNGGLIIFTSHQAISGIDNLTVLTLEETDLNAYYQMLGDD